MYMKILSLGKRYAGMKRIELRSIAKILLIVTPHLILHAFYIVQPFSLVYENSINRVTTDKTAPRDHMTKHAIPNTLLSTNDVYFIAYLWENAMLE
jgi:hypothetical protein